MWLLGTVTPNTRPATILVYLVIQGAGTGLALVPNTVAAMNALPARVDLPSRRRAVPQPADRRFDRRGGPRIDRRRPHRHAHRYAGTQPDALQGAYNDAFHLAFAWAVIATALAVRLPGRNETHRLQQERASEYQQLDMH